MSYKDVGFGDKALEKLLSDYKFNTVLDIGCGAGSHSRAFRDEGKDVTAVSLTKCPANMNKIRYIKGDFNKLDITYTYDLVWASHVLEHQPNVRESIQKLFSYCREGGVVAITVPPLKSDIVGGHLNLWNAGLLLYNIVSAGYNCKSARVLKYGYNISIIVNKEEILNLPELNWDRGDILKLKEYFPMEVTEPFDGNITKINWEDKYIHKPFKKTTEPLNLKFLITSPDREYFAWQILVQLNNLKKLGYDKNAVYLISYKGRINRRLKLIADSGKFKAKFHFYEDGRERKGYPVSQKPYLVKQYLKEFPEESSTIFFYTDPDVVFTKDMDFTKYLKDDVWYLSNTTSYLDTKYIKSKGEGLLEDMCKVANVAPELVISNDKNAGGAQWIVKDTTYEYWDRVEVMSEDLYRIMKDTSHKYNPKHPIQAWTAEMWATIWAAWDMGYITEIHPDLAFCWATHPLENWSKFSIFHNAGVTANTKRKHFSKVAHHMKTPFNKVIDVDPTSASYNYYLEIQDTTKNYPELIW